MSSKATYTIHNAENWDGKRLAEALRILLVSPSPSHERKGSN